MNKLFPVYDGEKINKIKMKQSIILSVDNEKYNKLRNEPNQFGMQQPNYFPEKKKYTEK